MATNKIFQLADEQARDEMGAGWGVLSVRLQRALVAERILLLVWGQDEDLPAARVRTLLDGATAALMTAYTEAGA